MEKLNRYYFYVEIVVLIGIFLSGLFDPSFWLFGAIFLGIPVSLAGSIISLVWWIKRLRIGGRIIEPYYLMIGNAILFVCLIMFTLLVFSKGITFLM